MSHSRSPELLTFHRSAPMPCPYLSDRTEQQLFAELSGPTADDVFNRLSKAGFRRSHHIVYRPVCHGCNACQPVRINARKFDWTKGWRRIRNKNSDLTAINVGLDVTQEQFDLFSRYLDARHDDGDMAQMSARDYLHLVIASPVKTSVVEFRDRENKLVAACLLDRLDDGLSAVYSFFDPRESARSLGSYMILWMIEDALADDLDYVYLGFWIEGSRKMEYKNRFSPLEAFGQDGWHPLNFKTTQKDDEKAKRKKGE
ncbi:MAG: arginyltransferase [Alphaproteobacteria bacterium]